MGWQPHASPAQKLERAARNASTAGEEWRASRTMAAQERLENALTELSAALAYSDRRMSTGWLRGDLCTVQ